MPGTSVWDERWVAGALASGDLDQHDSIGITPVWHAVYFSQADWFTRLLDAGADPDAHDDARIQRAGGSSRVVSLYRGRAGEIAAPTGTTTLLHVACASLYPDRIVEAVLARGFDVNARDPFGSTALHIAVSRDHDEVVELLLRAGADVNAVDTCGRMPLDFARDKLLFDRLLAAGASPDGGPRRARPIDWCCSIVEDYAAGGDDRAVSQLLARGADLSKHTGAIALAARRGHASTVRLLVEAGASVRDLPEPLGPTAIEAAASCGQIDTCEALDGAVPPWTPDELGRALVAAVARHADDLSSPPRMVGRVALYRWLLEHGASVDALDLRGEPLIVTAARFGHRELAEVLLAHGADPKTTASDGSSVYAVATRAYTKDKIDGARFVMAAIAAAGGGPAKPAAAPVAAAKIAAPGARVSHAKFGGGTITAIAGDKWTIELDTGETRTLLRKFLTLC